MGGEPEKEREAEAAKSDSEEIVDFNKLSTQQAPRAMKFEAGLR